MRPTPIIKYLLLFLGICLAIAADAQDRPSKRDVLDRRLPNKRLQRDSLPPRPAAKPQRPNTARAATRPRPQTPNRGNEPRDTSDIVHLDNANEMEAYNYDEEEVKFLKGGVVLHQGDAYFYCDSAYLYQVQNAVLAWGNVTIVQADTVHVFSDSLRYFGDTKDAYLIGDVSLTDQTQELHTERLDYNLESKIANYETGAVLKNGDSQLTSQTGVYDTNNNDAFFSGDVVVINEDFTLKADSMNYNTDTRFCDFLGPTLIIQDSAKIYCESGYYDQENKNAEFNDNPQYVKGDRVALADKMRYDGEIKQVVLEGNARFRENDRKANADVIRYNEETDLTRLEGNAHYQDDERDITADVIIHDGKDDSYSTEGKTIAKSEDSYVEADNSSYDSATKTTTLTGNVYVADSSQILIAQLVRFNDETGDAHAEGGVVWRDTVENTSIRAETLDYNDKTSYIRATGRPIMSNLMDGDTLYLSADTLISEKIAVVPGDSIELLRAYHDARLFKSDFQAVCDSMSYNSTDSVFQLYKQPVIWSDSSQFSADTVRISLREEQMDSVFLLGKALILDTPDEIFFNQVQGKSIIIKFLENNPNNMNVVGNGKSVFYLRDDEDAYIAVNQTTCTDMLFRFKDGELNRAHFYVEPTSTMHPMKGTDHEGLKLAGFKWEVSRRPLSPADLGSPHYILLDGDKEENPKVSEEKTLDRPLNIPDDRPSDTAPTKDDTPPPSAKKEGNRPLRIPGRGRADRQD